ncbi:glycoside hydrolase family 18 protein [Xylariaceae sp. FL0255]|nr:glycoside hydrolase family 18 protein [Xylariaceae sp. FL0255]
MLFTKSSAFIGLLAGLATALPAFPTPPAPRHAALETRLSNSSGSGQTVVYWGQNGGGTVENNDLSSYCASDSGIDVLVLAFLYEFGNGNDIPTGTIGQSCSITQGSAQNCDALSAAITTCQAAGVKIILSLGGASGSYTLSSDDEASSIGTYLWQAYGNGGKNTTGVTRPLGSAFVNGFDFDIEVASGQDYYASMISTLRTSFADDSANTYYITGAPQCPIPEPNMGIQNAQFDYLWPQFYNNNNYTYPCALPINGNAPFNYDQWVNFTSGTPSSNAQLFVGVPASEDAANGTPAGATYYATPSQLSDIVSEYSSHDRFAGIMMWSAGFSDANVVNGCTYAQNVHSILSSGSPC